VIKREKARETVEGGRYTTRREKEKETSLQVQ
jgi:hypothetical protein